MAMQLHAKFIENYLDHLRIEEARKDAEFVDWETVKAELNKKHGIDQKKVPSSIRTQSRKTA